MTSNSDKYKKWIYRSLLVLAYVSYVFFPIYAVLQKYPFWKEEGGVFASLGIGAMLIGIILAWTARNALSVWVEKYLGKFVWSQSKFWVGGTIILLVLNTVGNIVSDLLTIWIWGCIGMGLGMILTMIAKYLKKGETQDGTDTATQDNR